MTQSHFQASSIISRGVMSNGCKLPYFTPDYAKACFGVDAGWPGPASCRGGLSAAAGIASSAAATPASSFPTVGPAAPICCLDHTEPWPACPTTGLSWRDACVGSTRCCSVWHSSPSTFPGVTATGGRKRGRLHRALRATARSATPHDPSGGGQGRRPFRLRQQDCSAEDAHVLAGPENTTLEHFSWRTQSNSDWVQWVALSYFLS